MNVAQLVTKVKSDLKMFDYSVPEPIQADDLNVFLSEYETEFGEVCPSAYVDFLNLCDGLYSSDYVLYYCGTRDPNEYEHHLISTTKDWRQNVEAFKKYVFFGNSGLYLFAHEIGTNEYVFIERETADIIETFAEFDLFLTTILTKMAE